MEPYSAGFDYKEPIDEKTDVKIAVEEWQLIHVKEAGSWKKYLHINNGSIFKF